MTEMIERVARALCVLNGVSPDETVKVTCADDVESNTLSWVLYEPDARVAIEAMREPTGEMLAAPDMSVKAHGRLKTLPWQGTVWAAMIDAALAETPP